MSNITDSIRQAMRLAEQGRMGDAISSLRSLLTAHGNDATLHHSLGILQFQLGAMEQAVFHFDKARRLDTDRADMLSDYATALNVSGQTDEAADAFRKASEMDRTSFPAHLGLSSALIGLMDFDAAVDAARTACKLSPSRPEPWVNLALALIRSGQGDDAIKSLREALEIMPDQPLLLANLCAALNDRPEATPSEIFEHHVRLGRSLTAAYGGGIRSFRNDQSPDRPLRIGYISMEFRESSVAPFLASVLAAHDRDQYRAFGYSGVMQRDAATDRLRALAWDWRDISRMGEAAITQQMIADQIDILVELGGHAPGSRTGILAQRGAPVQVSWVPYPSTTGLRTVGYRLEDSITAPDDAEAFHTEKLVRLAGCFVAFSPNPAAPEVQAAESSEGITFGSFCPVSRIAQPVVETWAAILRGLSGSRLILKAAAFADDATARRFRDRFSGLGIGADRVECRPHAPSIRDHLAMYAGIDIALDTFPHAGLATTCEALDMGVPVITLAGKTHAGRTGASILTCLGMNDLIADSTGDYIRIAGELAGDRSRLASLRTGLRARLRNSPLCDGPGFTRKLESAYRDMWRSWCSSLMYT